jgi:N-acetylneuraminic acid mutarotase
VSYPNPICRTGIVQYGFAMLLLLSSGIAMAAPKNIDDRIACQAAIDSVRWSNMVWPESNPTPKPALADVLPPDAVRAKVHDQLRMEAALEGLYGIRIEAHALQAELNRMAAATRAPKQLRQLYDALDNDPSRVADCLVRPALVRQALESRYAFDPKLHAGVRALAQAELRRDNAQADTPVASGQDVTFVRDDGKRADVPAALDADPIQSVITLSTEQWHAKLAMLQQAGATATPTSLRETENGFVRDTLRHHDAHNFVVHTRIWPKTAFGAWWQAEAARWPAMPRHRPAESFALVLPPVSGHGAPINIAKGGGIDDTWRTDPNLPSARREHSAVWTGSEMIVWGGYTYDDGVLRSGARYSPVTDTWIPISLDNAPAARSGHVALWTGGKMIVFGGYNASSAGGIYDPASDTWKTMSTPPIAYSLGGFTAVWAGDEMIVWGGESNAKLKNEGARYFPATDTWSTTTLANAPSARKSHSAVWTGSRMVVWGGGGANIFNDGRLYNPETNTWTAMSLAGAPSARSAHSVVWTGTQMLVWGGSDGNVKSDGKRYSPALNAWLPMTEIGAPQPRMFSPAVWSGSEMIVWGGFACPQQEECSGGGRYNPATNQWSSIQALGAPAGRHGHTAVWAKESNEVLIWGGGGYIEHFATGARYSPALNQWTAVKGSDAVPSARVDHTVVWTGTEMIVWGGNDGNGAVASGGRYQADTATWVPLATAFSNRQRHTAVWTGTEMIVWGGADTEALSSGGRYNPMLDEWSNVADDGVAARYEHTAVWLDGTMIVWGGRDGNTMLDSGARYNPTNNTWALVSAAWAPSARYGHTTVAVGPDMLVWGGRSGNAVLGDGYRYSPASNIWTKMSAAGAPAERFAHSSVSTGKEMIVWGGAGEGFQAYADGARYSPADDGWTALPALNAPSERYEHAAVWTGEEMLVWGGYDGGDLATGGRYNPAENVWQAMSTLSAPAARRRHSAVWTGAEMIVWGGFSGSPPVNTLGAYSVDVTQPEPAIFGDGFE